MRTPRLCFAAGVCIALGLIVFPAVGAQRAATRPAKARAGARPKIIDRVACSTLCQDKQTLDKALETVSKMGYKRVDLAALSWCPHVSVKELLKDFDKESAKVEAALKAKHLKIANLTYDSFDGRKFDEYEKELDALAKFAAREKARLINLMAPSNKADRQDAVTKLKALTAIAKKHGVILTVETHVGQITEKPADALWLCKQVPGLGLTLDPSHYYAGPNQGADFSMLYPYVQGTGFRAGGMSWDTIQSPWGTGPIDFEKIIRDLNKAG